MKFFNLAISWNTVFNAYSHIITSVPVSVRFFNQKFYYVFFLCSILLTVEDFAGFVKNTKTHSYLNILQGTFLHLFFHAE